MSDVYWFIGGIVIAAFPLSILYMHVKEARDYFERDRNGKDAELARLRAVVRTAGAVTSEVRASPLAEGGWVKCFPGSARDVMNVHAMLAGRFDLIDEKRP
jgi:hypothetical protein